MSHKSGTFRGVLRLLFLLDICLLLRAQSIARIRPLTCSKRAGVPQLSHKVWL
jgi:hypothetical protein